jgi:peroxiredoxin
MADKLYKGDKAPDFTMPAMICGEFTLSSEVRNGPVLLYFYPTDFGMMCTYYMRTMGEVREEFDKANIRVFPISPDAMESHVRVTAHTDSPYDMICDIDQEVSRAYGMLAGPENPHFVPMNTRGLVLIDSEMMIRYMWRAEIAANIKDLTELLNELNDAMSESNEQRTQPDEGGEV